MRLLNVTSLLLLASALPVGAAECPLKSNQSLSGIVVDASDSGDGWWTGSVETATPCSVDHIKGRGKTPKDCKVGDYFGVRMKFKATGTIDSVGVLTVSTIQCAK